MYKQQTHINEILMKNEELVMKNQRVAEKKEKNERKRKLNEHQNENKPNLKLIEKQQMY